VSTQTEWQERSNRRFRGEGYAAHYEARYRGFVKGVLKHRWRCAILRRAFRDLPAGSSVLDIPCGTGRYTAFLRGQGYPVVGADIAPEMIGVARDRAAADPEGPRPRWLAANALHLPFPKKSLDACLVVRLFHLIPGDVRPAIYRELARVCRRQAVLCFNCNPYALKHLGKRLRGELPAYLMTKAELTEELRRGGLEVVRIHGKASIFSTWWVVVCRPAG